MKPSLGKTTKTNEDLQSAWDEVQGPAIKRGEVPSKAEWACAELRAYYVRNPPARVEQEKVLAVLQLCQAAWGKTSTPQKLDAFRAALRLFSVFACVPGLYKQYADKKPLKDFLTAPLNKDTAPWLLELFVNVKSTSATSSGPGEVDMTNFVKSAFQNFPENEIDSKMLQYAQALGMVATLDSTAVSEFFSAVKVFSVARKIIESPQTTVYTKRELCRSLSHLVVRWAKWKKTMGVHVLNDEDAKVEELVIRMCKQFKGDASAELGLLRNWCCNDRAKAKKYLEHSVHEIALDHASRPTTAMHGVQTAWGLLRNLARKQTISHDSMLACLVHDKVRVALVTHMDHPDVLVPVLQCAINLCASRRGRAALQHVDVDSAVVSVIHAYKKSSPATSEGKLVMELAVGLLWGTCTRSAARADRNLKDWVDAVLSVIQPGGEANVGCNRRAVGALAALCISNPVEAKKMVVSFKPKIEEVKRAFASTQDATLVAEVDVLLQLIDSLP